MFEEGGIFGGELSGHYYFRDFFGADSGIVPSLIILEMLSRKGVKLSQLLEPLEQQYFLSGEINTEVEDPAGRIQAVEESYSNGKVEHVDGVSVSYEDWHFNVRASNTEPLFRLNLEGRSRQLMEEKTDEVLGVIRS